MLLGKHTTLSEQRKSLKLCTTTTTLEQKIEAMWLLWHQTQHTTTDVICHPRKRLTACDDEPLVVSTRELVDHHMNTSWSKFDTHTRCSFPRSSIVVVSSLHLICLLMYLLMNLTERRGKNESFLLGPVYMRCMHNSYDICEIFLLSLCRQMAGANRLSTSDTARRRLRRIKNTTERRKQLSFVPEISFDCSAEC